VCFTFLAIGVACGSGSDMDNCERKIYHSDPDHRSRQASESKQQKAESVTAAINMTEKDLSSINYPPHYPQTAFRVRKTGANKILIIVRNDRENNAINYSAAPNTSCDNNV
jgi:hypothetical protein